MNLQQLRYVVEVDKHKSISRAAKSLYVSQPRVSTAIRELEGELRTQLFLRTSLGVETTEAGRAFIKDATDILAKADSLEQRFTKPRQEDLRQLKVAGPAADFCDQVMTLIVNESCEKNIGFRLSYICQLAFDAIDSVERGTAEIGIVSCKNNISHMVMTIIEQKQMEFNFLVEYPLCLAVSAFHPLASAQQVCYEDIIQYPIIYSDSDMDDNTSRAIATAFGREASQLEGHSQSIKLTDMMAISKLLNKTNAIYAMSAWPCNLDTFGSLVKLPGTLGSMKEIRGWVKRKNTPLSETAQLFIRYLNEFYKAFVHKNTALE